MDNYQSAQRFGQIRVGVGCCRWAGVFIAAETAQLEQLLLQNTTLLTFYQQLLSSNHWQEPVIANADALPGFQPLLNGLWLYLLQTYLAAQQGNWSQVELQLAADLRFWRSLLTENRYLLTKMTSSAAIERHFNLALQIYGVNSRTALVPFWLLQRLFSGVRADS